MTTPAAWNKCYQIKGLEYNKLESGKWLWLNLKQHPGETGSRGGGRCGGTGGGILLNPLENNFS